MSLSTRRVRWTEYWVSEVDAHGDIIDYVAQLTSRAFAEAEYERPAVHAAAVTKVLEAVRSVGSEAGGVEDRDYTTLAERTL